MWTVDYVKDNGVRYLAPAFESLFGRPPSFYELAYALVQSHHETGWGTWWKPPCDTSFNWGGVQSTTDEGCEYTDSGPSGRYNQRFVVYPNHVAGAAGYLDAAYRKRPEALKAAGAGDFDGFVRALYRASYFKGTRCLEKAPSGKCLKPDDEGNIADYQASLSRRLPDVEAALEALGYERPPKATALAAAAPWGALALGLGAGAGLAALVGPKRLRAALPRQLTPNRRQRAPLSRTTLGALALALVATAGVAWWLSRRTARVTSGEKLRQGDRVLLLGDSLAVGLTPRLGKLAGAGGFEFGSAAKTGSTMQYWLHAATEPLAVAQPTLVLVSLGTNDAVTSQPLAELRAQRDALVRKLQAAGARVLWVGPPQLPARARPEVRAMLEEWPAYFHSEDLPIPQHDEIHSTPEGYADWADAIWASLTA